MDASEPEKTLKLAFDSIISIVKTLDAITLSLTAISNQLMPVAGTFAGRMDGRLSAIEKRLADLEKMLKPSN